MNQQDRTELEALKQRQKELRTAAENLASEISRLTRRIESVEETMASRPVEIAPAEIKPLEVPPIPVEEKKVVEPPPIPVEIPPVIAEVEAALMEKQQVETKLRQPAPVPPPPEPPIEEPVFAKKIEPEPTATEEPPIAEKIPPTFSAPPPISKPKEKTSFEMRLGTFWFVRIGIVMLLTGMVFLGNYAYKNWVPVLGPAGKVSLLYIGSAVLLGVGTWLQRKKQQLESLRNYAQVLFAGGLAAVYFTTYAAHWIPNLRVIQNPVVDGLLLLAWAAFIVFIADRKKSEVLAVFAVTLAYYTSIITNIGLFTLYSNLILTAASVFFLVRNRWATLSFASLVATYTGFAFWRFFHDGSWLFNAQVEQLWHGNLFLAGYWIVFTAAVFLSRSEKLASGRRATFLSLNNVAFFSLVLLSMMRMNQGAFWKFALGYGSVLIGLAGAARQLLKSEPATKNTYLTQGLLLVTVGIIVKFSGLQLALILAAESCGLAILADVQKNTVLRVGAFLTAILATAWSVSATLFGTASLLLAIATGAFILCNAVWTRWHDADYEKSVVRPSVGFFTALALFVWCVATWKFAPSDFVSAIFALEALVLTASWYLLKTREISLFGQSYLFLGHLIWFLENALTRSPQPWSNAVLVIVATLALSQWWQRQKSLRAAIDVIALFRVTFAAVALVVGLVTLWQHEPREWFGPTVALLAVVVTGSYYLLRSSELTLFGQAYLVIAIVYTLWNATDRLVQPWWNPTLTAFSALALSQWWQRQKLLKVHHDAVALFRGGFAVAALVVGIVPIWQHVAPDWFAPTLSLLAVAVTVSFYLLRSSELTLFGQGYLAVALIYWFWKATNHVVQPWWSPAIIIAAAVTLSQWWQRQKSFKLPADGTVMFRGAFAVAALILGLAMTWQHAPAEWVAPIVALLAVGVTASFYLLRGTEFALFGQGYLAVAVLFWLWKAIDNVEQPWWSPAIIIGAALALSHWWQRQKALPTHKDLRKGFEAVYALALVGVLYFWLRHHFTPDLWLAITSILALTITAYGVSTRAWFLAACGQIFSLISAWQFVQQLMSGQPAWFLSLAPIAVIFATGMFVVEWFGQRAAGEHGAAREPVAAISGIYRWAATAMSLWWIDKYIPVSEQFWVLIAIAALIFFIAGWADSRETLWFCVVFFAAAVFRFLLLALHDSALVYWPNLIALFVAPVLQQMVKRRAANYQVPATTHGAVMIATSAMFLIYVSRWGIALAGGDSFLLTAIWAVLALLIFSGGFALRERVYRWCGLAILTLALGRVVFFDVWKLDLLYRIISLMALGVVLLVLGFFYNKYQEKIREWL